MKTVYIILIFIVGNITIAQQPLRALRTIMEVEYVSEFYQLGTGIIGLDDINSDGKLDFAVSAGSIGKTFIYYGGNGVLDDTVDLAITGGGQIKKGDLNGDGVMDLVIFKKGDLSSDWFNRLAVYLGRKDSIIKIDTVPSLFIVEEELGSDFGWTFDIGDINNDGYDDLVVGARFYGSAQGKIYFYLGKSNIEALPDTTIEGEITIIDSLITYYGYSINIKDINGDKINDLAIGADRRRFADSMWVDDGFCDIFYGKNNWEIENIKYDQRLDMNKTGFNLNYARLVDINNDDLSDISYAKGDSVYFFLGSSDSVSYLPGIIISNPDTVFYGGFSNPCCFDIGDINNDGINDFAFRAFPGGYSGCLIVYLGGSTPKPVAGRCKGFVAGQPFSPIVPVGDINEDGVDDFGTVAPMDPLGGPYNGYFIILSGDSTFVTSIKDNEEVFFPKIYLQQNFPNPFNPITTIEYNLPQQSRIKLYIYDSLGRVIIKLIDEEQNSGKHTIRWNGKNGFGESVASGTYFYQLTINGKQQETKKLSLLR